MTIDEAFIKALAWDYFNGEMPEDLRAYLYDRYGEEPLEGDLSPQFAVPAIRGDVKRYLSGELDTAVRTPLQKLRDRYDELSDITCSFARTCMEQGKELRYLSDFIRWMCLDRQYRIFRENAHEEYDEDMPFPHYTIGQPPRNRRSHHAEKQNFIREEPQ